MLVVVGLMMDWHMLSDDCWYVWGMMNRLHPCQPIMDDTGEASASGSEDAHR